MIGFGGHEKLFEAALNIKDPLYIREISFDKDAGELHIYIDFNKGARFACPVCGKEGMPIYDTVDKEWRHLNFFQYKAIFHFRTPRISCPADGVHLFEPPWAGAGDFTLLMDAFILQLAKNMAIKQVADILEEHDTKIWRIVRRYVQDAYAEEDYSDVTKVGVDETASQRGHNYVTIFVDMDESKVIYVTEGKDADTIKSFKEELPNHHSDPKNIKQFSSDMSPAFIRGIDDNFPWASMTFDKFHVIKLMNEAVDETRRLERSANPALKKTRYIWLKNPDNLTIRQQQQLTRLSEMNLKTGRAYRIKLALQDIYGTATDKVDAAIKMEQWFKWATRCRIEPVKEVAKTIKNNWNGILNHFDSGLTNGVLEGLNTQIQDARRRAKGFRNIDNFIVIIYLLLGKLSSNRIPKMEVI